MLIDYRELSEEALRGIIQQYVCSNLSEVDEHLDMDKWTEQVLVSVRKGELLIDYSENNESIYLRKPQELPIE